MNLKDCLIKNINEDIRRKNILKLARKQKALDDIEHIMSYIIRDIKCASYNYRAIEFAFPEYSDEYIILDEIKTRLEIEGLTVKIYYYPTDNTHSLGGKRFFQNYTPKPEGSDISYNYLFIEW